MTTDRAHPDDDTVLAELLPIIGWVDQWKARTSTRPIAPAEGSCLAVDDELTDPFRVSDAISTSIASAVDHLHALRTLLFDAGILHSRAPFTLLRATLENAAIALWLLFPEERTERVFRRLRLAWADVQDQCRSQMPAGNSATSWLIEQKAKVTAIGLAAGLTHPQIDQIVEQRPVSFTRILQVCGSEIGGKLDMIADHASEPPEGVLLDIWKLCSGIAHARPWAELHFLDLEELERSEKYVLLRATAPHVAVRAIVEFAAIMIRLGWKLIDQQVATQES